MLKILLAKGGRLLQKQVMTGKGGGERISWSGQAAEEKKSRGGDPKRSLVGAQNYLVRWQHSGWAA
jgi:hypothetical protein